MKNIFKFLFLSVLLTCSIWSCTKDEAKDYYLGGTNPVLSSSVKATIPISYTYASSPAITLSWTNPNYMFQTGVSSQNVTYTVQIDTTGSNFTNPNLKSLAVPSNLSVTILQSELNDYLLNTLILYPNIPHHIEMRVVSSLTNNSAVLTSNVLKFVATPYTIPPKVNPPTTGELYITGGATPAGWMGNGDAPLASQKFTQVNPLLYTITISLKGGDNTTDKDQFLMVPKYGDWSNKFAANKSLSLTESGGDFGYNWNDNFIAPAAAGTYLITVDFQRGKYSIVKQ